MTSPVRVEDFPDVPTMAEAGVPDVNVRLWSGLFAPAGTPPAIVRKLEAACLRIAAFPDVKEKLRAVATNAVGMGSQEFTRLIDDEIRSLTEIAKATNVKYDP
jgi:tripartite-type tricarboxylate transporter receptor subunit TctC